MTEKPLYSTVSETISSLSEMANAAFEAVRATLAHETATETPPTPTPDDQSCQNAKERLRLARQAMVDIGYFTEHEVGDDVAPRIWEYNIHVKRQIKHEKHQRKAAEKRADDLTSKLAQERARVDRVRSALDNTYQMSTSSGIYVPLNVLDEALKDPEPTP